MNTIFIILFILYFKNSNCVVICGVKYEGGNTLKGSDRIYCQGVTKNKLTISKYDTHESQITKVESMLEIEQVDFQREKQKIMITFKNVPKLRSISGANNFIKYIKSNMFGNTNVETVWIYSNNISSIEDGSFGKKIKIVSMYCNQLKVFRPEWFRNPSILTILDLNGNHIQYIQNNAFRNFSSLDRIDLGFNRIQTIGPGAFTSRTSFLQVLLAHNNLKEINSNIFQDNYITIKLFDLRYNSLTFLPKKLLNWLTVRRTPLLYGNPWKCSCYNHYLLTLKNWSNSNITDFQKILTRKFNGPTCVDTFESTCLESIQEELIYRYNKNTMEPFTNRNEYCSCIWKTNGIKDDWKCYGVDI